MLKILFVLTIVLEVVFVPIFLKYYWPQKCKMSWLFKMLSSTMFVLCGVLAIKISGNGTSYANMIVWGLIFGWIGDFFLHALTKNMIPFVLGVLAFLTGHIFYIIGLQKAIDTSYPAHSTFEWYEILAVIVMVVLVVAFTSIKDLFKTKSPMAAGLVFYGVFLALTLVKAARYVIGEIAYGTNPNMFMVTLTVGIGALLFTMSDVSLGIILSKDSTKRSMRVFNIVTYYAAQILLASSIFFVQSKDLILS